MSIHTSSSTTLPSIPTQLQHAKRVVIKIGSQILIDSQGRITIDRLAAFVRQLAWLQEQGKHVVLVTSGAIATGRPLLGFTATDALTRVQKQACAAVGQAKLVNTYEQLFHHYGVQVAQVLLNPHDFSHRWRYQSAKEVLEQLLSHNIIPILNENDALSDSALFEGNANVMALSFGDNDKLAALVASQLQADVLVVLSNVEGIYTANPFEDVTAQRLAFVPNVDELIHVNTAGKSLAGRGGMASKLDSTAVACHSGVHVVIASGLKNQALQHLFEYTGEDAEFPATFVQANAQPTQTSWKRWIGYASGYAGIITINAGATDALLHKGASLLGVGVVACEGHFSEGNIVSLHTEAGQELGRGVVAYSSAEIQRRCPHECLEEPLIHRDKLMLFQHHGDETTL
ncbi:MAG: glutamate 5-kinase [Vampirovibrionales bacterium]